MQFNFYSLGFALCSILMLYIIRLARGNPGFASYHEFKALLWLFFFANMCMFAAMSSTNLAAAYFFHELKFVSVTMVPPLLYIFCYRLNGIKRKNYKKLYILLCSFPVLTLIGIATNPLHNMFCVSHGGDLVGTQVYLTVVRGPFYMMHAVYGFGLSALTVVVQLVALRRLPRGHRVTSYFLLAGLAVNVSVTIYSAFGGAKYGDPGIWTAPVFAALMYVGMMMKPNIVLNAANRITVENMKSFALFFDLDKTLISANESARAFFDLSSKSYGSLTEEQFFTEKLGIEYTGKYPDPDFSLHGYYFQIDDHQLTDDTGLVCGRALVLTDVTGLRNTVNNMEYALNHDALTGVLNQAALLRRMERGFEPPVSFIACGIRGMKIINNLFGYEYGDTVIKTAVNHIVSACSGGICARYAGDVFVAVLPQTGEAKAKEIIFNLQSKLEADQSLFVPVRMWCGSQTAKKHGDFPEQTLNAAFGELDHAKLMYASDDISLDILQYAQIKSGISDPEKSELLTSNCQSAGRAMGLDPSGLGRLGVLSRIYDVGLVSMPRELISQKGHLTNEQWRDYKLHVERGCRIARMSPSTLQVSGELMAHHEYYDGMGYPNHLKGGEIPLLARILSAGIFLTDLIYDGGMLHTEALGKLKSFSGTRFDPAVVEAYLSSDLKIPG